MALLLNSPYRVVDGWPGGHKQEDRKKARVVLGDRRKEKGCNELTQGESTRNIHLKIIFFND